MSFINLKRGKERERLALEFILIDTLTCDSSNCNSFSFALESATFKQFISNCGVK
jgi:hypothetical protein